MSHQRSVIISVLIVGFLIWMTAFIGVAIHVSESQQVEPAKVSANFTFNESNNQITAAVINQNAESVSIRVDGRNVKSVITNGTTTGYATYSITGRGTAELVAVVNETEQVVETVDYNSS